MPDSIHPTDACVHHGMFQMNENSFIVDNALSVDLTCFRWPEKVDAS